MRRRLNTEHGVVKKVVCIVRGIVDIDNQSNRVRTAAGKAPRKVVGHIFQLFHRRINALLRFLGNHAFVIEHS